MKNTSDSSPSVRENVRGVATRARLLDAAVLAFSARGFHGTSTRDIADAAGLSPGALYAHYDTKEQLLFQISIRGHHEIHAVVTESLSGVTRHQDRLASLVRAFVQWHARCHLSARVIQHEMAALTPEHLAQVAAVRRSITQVFREVLADGMRAGTFTRTDERLTATALLSMGIDVARWYRPSRAWSEAAIAEHYSRLALAMVGAGPA